jgi:ABC-type phosphate transport system substrate-binding protein
MYLIKKPKTLKHKLHAVSPVVATLVLIVISIVGAISVGLIMSRISSDTSSNANVLNAAGQSQGTLLIGGSTTVYPITEALKTAFQDQYKVNIIDAQGGSDAGMQGVLSGALDIGAASSAGAVNNLENAITSNSINGVTVNYVLIGGSVVVPIENGAGANGMFTDGANECLGISQDALSAIYQLGTFGIDAAACAAASPTFSTLLSSGIAGVDAKGEDTSPSDTMCTWTSVTTATLSDGASMTFPACVLQAKLTPVSRADNSGTEDQMASFLAQHPPKQSSGGNWAGTTEQGNPGVLNYVNTNAATVGFVDLGFAEGAATGSVCPSGHVAQTTCGVGMPQVFTSAKGVWPTGLTAAPVVMTSKAQGYIAKGASTSAAESLSKAALKSAANVNPLTLSGQSAAYPDTYAPGTGLARTFYYVTNGQPTPVEQEFISFATNYNQEYAYTNNGYYSQYDFTSA